jgi:hypothetical protein
MTETNDTPSAIEKDKIINPGDVECANECNKDWQECLKENPEREGTCHLKLAKCVKECN